MPMHGAERSGRTHKQVNRALVLRSGRLLLTTIPLLRCRRHKSAWRRLLRASLNQTYTYGSMQTRFYR